MQHQTGQVVFLFFLRSAGIIKREYLPAESIQPFQRATQKTIHQAGRFFFSFFTGDFHGLFARAGYPVFAVFRRNHDLKPELFPGPDFIHTFQERSHRIF